MGLPLALAGASMGLGIMNGLMGYMSAQEAAQVSESRGRMLMAEAENDAQRYGEQAQEFKANQKLKYLKSGVTLEGSPLDILDETSRNAQEQISAIRAQGRAQQADQNAQARATRAAGRSALIGGIAGAAATGITAGYASSKNTVKQPGSTGFSTKTGPQPSSARQTVAP